MKKASNNNDLVKAPQNVYEKRFYLMLKLFRIHQMLKQAKITYPAK
jgi:hypothetical protein